MSLSNAERVTIVQALLDEEITAALRASAAAGQIDPGDIHRQLSTLLNDHPVILGLETNDQRAVLGQAAGPIKRLIPPPPRDIGAGERVLGLKDDALHKWRRELVKQMATPVAFLYDQARHCLELESGHPRRRDLAWDIVNTATTAVRYAAVVAIADYVKGGLNDPQLNRALVETIAKPADGSWSSLLWSPDAGPEHSLLTILGGRDQQIAELVTLSTKLNKSDTPEKAAFGTIKGLPGSTPKTLKDLAGSFVTFRNALVHGPYSRKRPDDQILDQLGRLLDVLLATLEPLLCLPLVVLHGDDVLLAAGPTLGALNDPGVLGKLPLDAGCEDLPVLISGDRRLPLSPWVTLFDLNTAVHQAAEDAEEGDVLNVALSEICFFNRFEADLVHYLGFAARAQLPHIDLVESERAESAFQAFSKHMEDLRLKSAPAAARKADPVQRFDQLAGFHGENFVGRADVIGNIEQFVATPPAPMGVIKAGPGMGKSAILTHFYRQHGGKESADGWLFHFSARADQRDNAVLGLRSLIAQGETQLKRNQKQPTKWPPLPWSYEDLCARFLEMLTALGACMAAQGKQAVVVIDALDEQAPRPGAPPESIFGGVPDDIPEHVVFLVSVRIGKEGRPVAIDAGQLGAPRGTPIPLTDPLSGLTPDDVKALVREKLAEEKPELAQAPQEVLDRVAQAAQRSEDGTLDPFYLRFLADGVREGTVDLSEAGNVPAGLENFFDDLWWGLDTSHDFLLHRMVGMLSEMEGFGADALFAEALHKPEDEVARLRFGINKLLVQSGAGGDEARYGLFHDRFRWYVQSKFRARDKAMALHMSLLEACRRGVSAADQYAARYTTYHLAALSEHGGLQADEREAVRDELWATIHDDQFIERKFTALGDERAVIVDFTRAFEVFRPKPEDSNDAQLTKAGQVTWLADRCAKTVAQVANLARARLHDYAREGDAVRVIQLSERAGGDALRWMTLLRAAKTMRTENLDPTPLFEAIQASATPTLLWTDSPMLDRLLTDADAPEDLRSWVMARVPEKPQVDERAQAQM